MGVYCEHTPISTFISLIYIMHVGMIINPINTAVGQHCNSNRGLLYYIAVNGTNERLYVGRLPALLCKIPPSEWNFRA